MPSYAGHSASRPGDIAGTLRLLAYLALASLLIVLDHRGAWLSRVRQQAQVLIQPVRAVAGLPGRLVETVSNDAGTLSRLTTENRRLRNELLVAQARISRLATVDADNARLRGLLAAAEQGTLDVQLAPVLDIDLDPTRQRLVLNAGRNDGVHPGQTVIDAGGVLGQIIESGPMQSTVLLLTDPDHAIPVAIARNGVRMVAYGTGRADRLALASVPLSSDLKVGDMLVTSGLGGRFAAGFPVGTVTALHPDESRAFLVGEVKPAAQLDRGADVLLLRVLPARPVIGPGRPGIENGESGIGAGTQAASAQNGGPTGQADARVRPAAATSGRAGTAPAVGQVNAGVGSMRAASGQNGDAAGTASRPPSVKPAESRIPNPQSPRPEGGR